MRGFLAFVLLLLAALVVVALVGLPMVVRPMVADAVRTSSPFGDQPLDVDVEVNPLGLLVGSIDRIRVRGSGLEAEGAVIGALDLTLSDVDTSSRSFRSVAGRLTAVALPVVVAQPLVIDTIELSGRSESVRAVARLDLRSSLSLLGNAIADAGIAVDGLELVAGGVAFGVFGQRLEVALGVDAGALVLPDVGGGGPLVIVEPGPDDPWRITGVDVTPAGLAIHLAFDQ